MIQEEWLSATDLEAMMDHLYPGDADNADYPSFRKLRLLVVAYCRRIWPVLAPPFHRAVEAAESVADAWPDYRAALVQLPDDAPDASFDALDSAHEEREVQQKAAENAAPRALDEMIQQHPLDPADERAKADIPAEMHEAFHEVVIGERVRQSLSYRANRVAWWAVSDWGGWPPRGAEFVSYARDVAAAAPAGESLAQCGLLRCLFNPFRPCTLDPSWLSSTVTTLAQQMYDTRDFSAMPILADALADAGCENEAILSHCRGPGPHTRGCWVTDACLAKS